MNGNDGGRRSDLAAPVLCGLALGFGLAALITRRFASYEVRGESMVPTLAPGDYLIADRRAYRARVPRVGDIVLARDPREAARTLVKRVAAADGGRVDLRGDNAGQSTDSRAFGRVEPGAVIGRVRWRYWPHPGRVR